MSLQSDRWDAWKKQQPEAQVALDGALEKLAQDRTYLGCRWALPVLEDVSMPPHMGWLGEAEPGVSWEDLAAVRGDTLQTPNRHYLPDLNLVLVRVNGGRFRVGASDETYIYRPRRDAELNYDFWIGQFPITNQQYRLLVDEALPPSLSLTTAGFNAPFQPVSGLSWEEAMLWCKRAGKKTRQKIGLPTELEWERAARTDLGMFPWREGGIEPRFAHLHPAGPTQDVTRRPLSASPWGCEDMLGNVWEWCQDHYGSWPKQLLKNWSRSQPLPDSPPWRVLKGGAYLTRVETTSACFAGRRYPDQRELPVGFRVVMTMKAQK